ncbi:MAG: penicillin-binding protein 2 [Oscillospiraceae bacterium]|nr:penicillin-binding protein 2 [Oscillospiraceae bacterium]
MKIRMAAAYAVFILLFGMLTARLSLLSTAVVLVDAAQQQSAAVIQAAKTRGVIYDRYMRPITGTESKNIAAVLPNEQSADALMRATPPEKRMELQQKLSKLQPFLWEVPTAELYAKGLEVFKVPQRYSADQPALHLIGQLDPATEKGASGLEKAYDQLLASCGGTLQLRYATDALQRGMGAAAPEIIDSGYLTKSGIVLTLDLDIQQIVEQAAKKLDKGAVVVMDPNNGDILACASVPTFDPNNPSSALSNPDKPFFNRSFAAYSVGSTFKLLTAAAAIEMGYTPDRSYECKGYIEVKDQIFKCHNIAGHGKIDMQEAMNKSCNPYFISLALEIGGPSLLYKAQQLGFSAAFEAAPGMKTAAGSLPDARELIAPAAVANFGFGQGRLTATPIQIASLISAFANGGGAVTPRLVAGSTADGEGIKSQTVVYSPKTLFTKSAADAVAELMISVVEQGSGKNALPEFGGAGGKTASAQTGQFIDGKETVHAWFSGFYPAIQPRYSIVVLAEGGDSGSDAACPIFAEIANGIGRLEQSRRIYGSRQIAAAG